MFANEQIAMAIRQHEAGTTVGEICRKREIGDTTQPAPARLAARDDRGIVHRAPPRLARSQRALSEAVRRLCAAAPSTAASST
jgi:hypothetical protein